MRRMASDEHPFADIMAEYSQFVTALRLQSNLLTDEIAFSERAQVTNNRITTYKYKIGYEYVLRMRLIYSHVYRKCHTLNRQGPTCQSGKIFNGQRFDYYPSSAVVPAAKHHGRLRDGSILNGGTA